MKKSFFEREDRKCLDLAYKTGKVNTYWNCMESGGWDFNSINLNDSWSERKKDSFQKSYNLCEIVSENIGNIVKQNNRYYDCMSSFGWDSRKFISSKKSFHDKDRDFCKSLALKIFKADRYFSCMEEFGWDEKLEDEEQIALNHLKLF